MFPIDQVLPKDKLESCPKCEGEIGGPRYVQFNDQSWYWIKNVQSDGLRWECKACGWDTLTACKDSKA